MLPEEYALLAWIVMMALSVFTSPRLDISSYYIGSAVLLAVSNYLYARAFAASPGFLEDVLFGGLFLTAICSWQIILLTSRVGLLGDSATQSHVGLAMLPELCVVGILSFLFFHRGHSPLTTIAMLIYAMLVIVPLVIALGTRSLVLSSGAVLVLLIGLRAWHGGVARYVPPVLGVLAAAVGAIVLLWPSIERTKFGILIAFGSTRLISGLAENGVRGDPSALLRLQNYDHAWDIFYRSPIFGTGAGSFAYLASGGDGAYPHNMFLELLVQGGLFGTLLFAAFFVPLALKGFRAALVKPADWALAFAIALFTSAFIRHQISMSITQAKLLFFALGCIAAGQIRLAHTRHRHPGLCRQPVEPNTDGDHFTAHGRLRSWRRRPGVARRRSSMLPA